MLVSYKKLFTTLGEKLDEYIVRTTIIVEKVNVVIVSSDPESVPSITLANSTRVKKRSGIKSSIGTYFVSISIAPIASIIEINI